MTNHLLSRHVSAGKRRLVRVARFHGSDDMAGRLPIRQGCRFDILYKHTFKVDMLAWKLQQIMIE